MIKSSLGDPYYTPEAQRPLHPTEKVPKHPRLKRKTVV